MEIPVGSFSRRLRIARPIDADEVEVSYRDGMLRVALPKVRVARVDVPIA
jgi:HSP20 family molecular chaperone IbpA